MFITYDDRTRVYRRLYRPYIYRVSLPYTGAYTSAPVLPALFRGSRSVSKACGAHWGSKAYKRTRGQRRTSAMGVKGADYTVSGNRGWPFKSDILNWLDIPWIYRGPQKSPDQINVLGLSPEGSIHSKKQKGYRRTPVRKSGENHIPAPIPPIYIYALCSLYRRLYRPYIYIYIRLGAVSLEATVVFFKS